MQPQRTLFYFYLSHEQFPVPELINLGIAAEQAGFDGIATSDHFHPWQDNEGHAGLAWMTLAALGQRTSRLHLGTTVTCPTFRYRPAIVAEAFASLALLYPGRIYLGLGTGEAVNEVPAGGGWGNYQERAGRLVEAVQIIQRLWSGEWTDFNGTYYQIKQARLYDVPPQRIPLYIAAGGPKSMRLAGQYGDGLINDSERAQQPEMRAAFAEGARGVGKNPQAMPLLTEQYVVVGDQQEAARWAELWRFQPKSWQKFVHDPDPRSIKQHADQEVPLDSVYGKWPVSTDPEVHVQHLNKQIAAGATQIAIHSPQADQMRVVQFYGREVLPRLRNLAATTA